MKTKLIVAFLLYTLGLIRIIDWVIFSNKNEELSIKNHAAFIAKYDGRFPDLISNTEPVPTLMSIIFFLIAGLLFLKHTNIFFRILAISAFVFAFWNLFSLM